MTKGCAVDENLSPYANSGQVVNAERQDVAGEGRAEGVLDSTHGDQDGNNLASGPTGLRAADSGRHGDANKAGRGIVGGHSCSPDQAFEGLPGVRYDDSARIPTRTDEY